jgi:hypothetical protein
MKNNKFYERAFRAKNIILAFSLSLTVLSTLLLMTLIRVDEGGRGIVFMWAGTACILFIEGFIRSKYSGSDYPSNAFSRSGILGLLLIYAFGFLAFLWGFLFIIFRILK